MDIAVVGGGVTGLACARALAGAGLSVRVLEARVVGGGASGRNGGFGVRGPALPYVALPFPELWRFTERALDRLADLAGDAFRRVGCLSVAETEEELDALHRERDALVEAGFAAELVGREELPAVLRPHFLGGFLSPRDGAIEPGRWSRRLAELAAEAGAAIAEGTRAVTLEGTGVLTDAGTVKAERIVLATDGYTHGLAPELDALVTPARAQVLATAPLPERHFACPVGARGGWDYWQQTQDGRLVIGGWRDAELERESTTEDEPTDSIQARIEEFLGRLLGEVPPVTHRWAGLLGFTPDRLPLAGRVPGRENVWTSLGYCGHGNVLALGCGELVAGAILGRDDPLLAAFDPARLGL